MRAIVVTLVLLGCLAVSSFQAPVQAQVGVEAGAAVNVITAELMPAIRVRLENVLATYLAQANPNLTMSFSVARLAIIQEATAHFNVAGGFELFLGPEGLPAGGQGHAGVGFDVVVHPIHSRLGAQVLVGYGTRGFSLTPTLMVSLDVGAVIGLIGKTIDNVLIDK